MSDFTSILEIKNTLNKKWDSAIFLKSAISDEFNVFPLKIKLKSPPPKKLCENMDILIKWSSELSKNSKQSLGYGYNLISEEKTNRIIGKNKIPTYIEFENIDDCIKFINKNKQYKDFLNAYNKVINFKSELKDYILKSPFKVLNNSNQIDKIIIVLDWFLKNTPNNLYLRQLDIENIDTKFIENNLTIISEMLDVILPKERIDFNKKLFTDRYYLKSKPILVRFRILDEKMKIAGITDFTIPIDEFEKLEINFKNVFFVENEINFLSFPNVLNSCVVFSGGYGVSRFKNAKWLCEKNLYYWGDIDTHGFNILSMAREYFPNISSFLMTEQVLLAHKSLWVDETKQCLNTISRLDNEEFSLVCKLQDNYFGKLVRLEQERIRFSFVKSFLDALNQK